MERCSRQGRPWRGVVLHLVEEMESGRDAMNRRGWPRGEMTRRVRSGAWQRELIPPSSPPFGEGAWPQPTHSSATARQTSPATGFDSVGGCVLERETRAG